MFIKVVRTDGELKTTLEMTIYLTRNEIFIYFGVYVVALAYGLYHAYVAGTGESLPLPIERVHCIIRFNVIGALLYRTATMVTT